MTNKGDIERNEAAFLEMFADAEATGTGFIKFTPEGGFERVDPDTVTIRAAPRLLGYCAPPVETHGVRFVPRGNGDV